MKKILAWLILGVLALLTISAIGSAGLIESVIKIAIFSIGFFVTFWALEVVFGDRK